MYELMEGKVVNRRAVWKQREGSVEAFMCSSVEGHWIICGREDMEGGANEARAWLSNKYSRGYLTPSSKTEGWKVVSGEATGECTEDAPGVRTRDGGKDAKEERNLEGEALNVAAANDAESLEQLRLYAAESLQRSEVEILLMAGDEDAEDAMEYEGVLRRIADGC
jgi:hypothetical protein